MRTNAGGDLCARNLAPYKAPWRKTFQTNEEHKGGGWEKRFGIGNEHPVSEDKLHSLKGVRRSSN